MLREGLAADWGEEEGKDEAVGSQGPETKTWAGAADHGRKQLSTAGSPTQRGGEARLTGRRA